MLVINPNNISSYAPLTRLYFYTGMNELSIATGKKAYKLDPKNPHNHNLGVSYYNAGLFQKGIDFINVFDKKKTNAPAQLWLGMNYYGLGQNNKALDTFKNIVTIKSTSELANFSAQFYIAMIQGDKNKTLQILDNNMQQIFLTGARLNHWAGFYALLGEKDKSLAMLRKSVDLGFYNYPQMQGHPYFEGMKDNTEYQEILALAKQKHLAFKQAISKQIR